MPEIILILNDVRSTFNVGSLLRTSDGLGVTKVYLCGITPYPKGGHWLMNPPGGGDGRSGGGGGGRAGGSTDSMRAAMAESLKRNGRPPVLQGEILPPMTPRPALTFRPQLPPPEHFNS